MFLRPSRRAPEAEPASRLTQPLALLLLLFALFSATTAIAMPVNQLTQSGGAATLNVSESASVEALRTVPHVPSQAFLTPPSDNGLVVNVVTEAAADGGAIPWQLRLLTDLGTSVWAVALAVIAYLLALILGNIASGDPFNARNAIRLSWITIAILVGSVGADAINLWSAHVFRDYLQLQPPLQATAYFSITPLVMAALVLVLASAFRRGRAIQDDVEGLV